MLALPQHTVSVAGVVVDEREHVLVIRRADNGHWEPPGGVLELAERFEDGVRREVLEETGLTVAVHELSGVYKNLAMGVVALVFRCSPIRGTIHTTDEAGEVRWMTRDEVRSHMDPAFGVRVTDAFQPGAQYRAHDGVALVDPRSVGKETCDCRAGQ